MRILTPEVRLELQASIRKEERERREIFASSCRPSTESISND
jgi:hypothetical protein